MEILVWAFLGGVVGSALMDITETIAAKRSITSGVNIALVGRWFLGLLRGQFTHSNIYSGPHFQDNSLSCALLHGDIRNERSKEAEGPHPRVQGQGGS